MEVLRKRSHHFCGCSLNMLNGTSRFLSNDTVHVVPSHMHDRDHTMEEGNNISFLHDHTKSCTQWNQELGTAGGIYHHDTGEDVHAQKRKCNGVSSYFLQADNVCASSHSSIISSHLQQGAVSSSERFLANENNATSCASFQTYSPGPASSYTTPTVPLNLKNSKMIVCQRCLAGEAGHIGHIM